MIYEYDIAADTNDGVLDLKVLSESFRADSIEFSKIKSTSTKIFITTDEIKTVIDPYISAHVPSTSAIYETMVTEAIGFFGEIMVEFAASNVGMGITYYNKTEEVADYLQEVMRYGQSGSLHAVIHTIDNLIAATIPVSLSPFVTEARLLDFKASVSEYLS